MSEVQDLISTLVERTRTGEIRWEQADSRARRFTAKRQSGTVTISGPGTDLVPRSLIPGGNGVPAIVFEVLDAEGNLVQDVEYVPRSGMASMLEPTTDPPALRQLSTLYDLVREQVVRSRSTMRSLVAEFRKPDPEAS